MKKIIIVGGGAAGMMAAVHASQDCDVLLFERNEKLGKKVFITGKGRCNVTNACDTEDFFKNVLGNYRFLYSSVYGYDSSMVMDFFESNGCSLKIERGERVFPVSDHSSDIIRTLENYLRKSDVKIFKNKFIEDIIVEDGIVKGIIDDTGNKIYGDAVIIATGGVSYDSTGSDGNMHKILEKYGHTISDFRPGLVPLTIEEQECMDMMGLSLKNVTLSVYDDNKKIYEDFGEMLFTHFGISGPLALSASSVINHKYYGKKLKLYIDLKPALDSEKLDKRILRDFDGMKNKQFKNSLNQLLPSKMVPVIIHLSGINPEKMVNEITREERLKLCHIIKKLEFTITGTRDFKEAIITIGGVNLKEINPSTMESKIIKNLYLAGEMLDLDAYTGGFNLQIAWSTGKLAGESAAL